VNAPLPQELVTAASAVAAIAINALWQDALLVLGVWALLRAWPHLNASTRYTVWSATLVAAVIVPAATTVPFLAAPPPPVSSKTGAAPAARTPILTPGTVAARHAEPSVASGAGGGVASETLPRVSPLRFPERFRLTLPLPVAIGIAAAWALLAALALIRLAVGIAKLEKLKRDALPLPVEYRDAMARWTAANKGSRDVRLCVSDETDVPVAVGLFDSMILIPRVLLDQLSEAEVDQISLHELAHLRRADDWTNGLQRVLLALLAWNPAARFIGQQLDLEREVACDDWVLSLTGAVRPYALCLTKMAETSSWPRAPIPAPGVFATRKHISLRIERLLGAGRNVATTLAIGPAAAAVAIVGALAFVIAIVAPSIAAPVAPQTAQPGAVTAAKTQYERIIVLRSDEKPGASHVAQAAPPAAAAVPSPAPLPSSVHIPAIHVHAPGRTIAVPPVNIDVPAHDIPVATSQAQREKIAMEAQKAALANAAGASASAAAAAAAAAKAAAGIGPSIARAFTGGLRGMNPPTVAQNAQSCMACNFSGVDWSGRDLHGVNYTGSDFSKAKLHGTNFASGHFEGVDFSHADLRGASFRDATLTGVDFTGADLTGTDFGGAKLSGSDFTGADLTSAEARSVLDSCTGCDFSRANLAGMNLSNVRINGDDFSHADLRNANLSGATITGADLSGVRLDGANLDGATLSGVDLGGVDLSHVDLSKTHLVGVDLSHRGTPKPR
jgi:uncharacterized protein YjbI with pentapeptide repeats/beta-lactamase regulating signal transducer with metallopeptidase domain